uniref:PH domain-containing protein n=1 Tax=Glossina palpalis gambiensis TaxID=67801 RepID=A0A1B0AXF6_9MUSC
MDSDLVSQTTKDDEITQFICDIRDYLRASLEPSEYENTSTIFYVTTAEVTEQLLNRCNSLLQRLNDSNNAKKIEQAKPLKNGSVMTNDVENYHQNQAKVNNNSLHYNNHINVRNNNTSSVTSNTSNQSGLAIPETTVDDVLYLNMSPVNNQRSRSSPREFKILESTDSTESIKSFRDSSASSKGNKSFLYHHNHINSGIRANDFVEENLENALDDFDNDDDPQIYDICQVTTQGSDGEEDYVLEETHKAIPNIDSDFPLAGIDCPYVDLPAGHLAIQTSANKYGQLQRIEKRIFFDQSKKYYCGILNDWFLCYAEGPTTVKPTITLHLKMPGIEIEHFGEGKRRDVCFQISTSDPNKRFVFQAANEVDAKEWIHAIEAAIRNDTNVDSNGSNHKINARKSCTAPTTKRITFLSSFHKLTNENKRFSTLFNTINDCIYEEPSPLYQVNEPSELLIDKDDENSDSPPVLPLKQTSPAALAQKFDYDIPTRPAQPLKSGGGKSPEIVLLTTSPDTKASSGNTSPERKERKAVGVDSEDGSDFQTKVRELHSKLSSQLAAGPNLKKINKKSYTAANQNDSNSLIINSLPSTPKNWLFSRLSKTTSSTRSFSSSSSSSSAALISPTKCKSEKQNLLNFADSCESGVGGGFDSIDSHLSSNPNSPILKTNSPLLNSGKSKVNMIINKLEATGHQLPFGVDVAVASFSSFCENDCNNYETIVTNTY